MTEEILNFFIANGFYIDSAADCSDDIIEMDSLTFIMLVVEIEDHFSITLPDECLLLENFNTIRKIVYIINQMRKNQ